MSTAPEAAKAAKAAKADPKAAKAADAKAEKPAAAAKAEKAAKPAKAPAAKKKAEKKADAPKRPAHAEGRLAQVLVAPIVSEKATMAAEKHNQVLFKVLRDATKPEIKAAVELMFNVSVAGVQVVNETGKSRRFGKLQGRTQDIKKAYVRLAQGQTIDYEAKLKA